MIDKKEILLQAAEELFGENGFEGTSMRQLAKKAGMNVAMVSYYFGSKDKLFEELVRRKTEKTRATIERANREKQFPREKMEMVIETIVENIFSNRHFHRLLYREITLEQRPLLNDTIGEILLGNKKRIRHMIEEGIAAGDFRKVDVDLCIATIFGTINSVLISEKLTLKMFGEKNLKHLYPSLMMRLKKYLNDWLHVYLMKPNSRPRSRKKIKFKNA